MLHPCVLDVPDPARRLRGVERVSDLRRRARDAARWSADLTGLPAGPFRADHEGRPLVTRGVHWSVSHTRTLVAGIVSTEPVAIDVERLRPHRTEVLERALSPQEARILGGYGLEAFIRAWTAKEAALKLTGLGLRGLSRARIARAGRDDASVEVDGAVYRVQFRRLPGHVVALAGGSGTQRWHLSESVPMERRRERVGP